MGITKGLILCDSYNLDDGISILLGLLLFSRLLGKNSDFFASPDEQGKNIATAAAACDSSKLIIISNNCSPLRKSEIEYYAMLSKVGVHHYNGNKNSDSNVSYLLRRSCFICRDENDLLNTQCPRNLELMWQAEVTPVWPAFHQSAVHSSPLLYDIVKDGVRDIVLSTSSSEVLFLRERKAKEGKGYTAVYGVEKARQMAEELRATAKKELDGLSKYGGDNVLPS
ncbi:hypothetical protein ACFE04_021039 [Oxalis oulophora]